MQRCKQLCLLTCTFLFALAGTSLVFSTPAAALSPGQQKIADRADKSFQRKAKGIAKRCGMKKIEAKIDWTSFQTQLQLTLDRKIRYGFGGYCNYVLDQLYTYCGKEISKRVVQAAFQSYTCKFGGKGKRKLEYRKGHVTFWVDWKASNNGKFVRKHLGRKLPDPLKKGLTLGQRLHTLHADKSFQSNLKNRTKSCGFGIKASIDWPSFKGELQRSLDRKHNYGFSGYCGSYVFSQLDYACKNPKLRRRVKRKIKRFVCKFGGKGRRKIRLRRGTLTLWIDWKASNYGKFVRKFFNNKL